MAAELPSLAAAHGATQNQAWAKNKSNFGYKMLLRMGWKEGKGLGKKEDGDVTHVKVKRKSDSEDRNKIWLGASQSYADLLEKLNKEHPTPAPTPAADDESRRKRRRKSDKKAKSRDVRGEERRSRKEGRRKAKEGVEDGAAAPGGSAGVGEGENGGKKAGGAEKGDKKDKKAKKKVRKAKARDNGTIGARVHRYHKVLTNKKVSNYSSADLAVILGAVPGYAPTPVPTPSPAAAPAEREGRAGGLDGTNARRAEKGPKKERDPRKRPRS